MADKLKRVVVDSCVVLDLLLDDDPEHASRAEHLLDGHGDRHTVVIPAIVIPEIAGTASVRGNQGGLAVRQERIEAVTSWIRRSNYLVAELSDPVARRAAALAIAHDLQGPDAAVLATAELIGSPHLYTRDDRLLKCDGTLGFKITVPDPPPHPPPGPTWVQPDLFDDED